MSMTKFKGTDVKLAGTDLKIGDKAPIVKIVAENLSEITVGGAKDKNQIIVVVPSLDTAVCATEARQFNTKATQIDNAEVVIVSMDLPFAMNRFCTTEGIDKLKVGSDFRNKDFAKSYGVLQENGPLAGLTARVVFIVNKKGEIAYKEIVPEITSEPDYDKVLEAAKKLN